MCEFEIYETYVEYIFGRMILYPEEYTQTIQKIYLFRKYWYDAPAKLPRGIDVGRWRMKLLNHVNVNYGSGSLYTCIIYDVVWGLLFTKTVGKKTEYTIKLQFEHEVSRGGWVEFESHFFC